jgi:hypothetical protein
VVGASADAPSTRASRFKGSSDLQKVHSLRQVDGGFRPRSQKGSRDPPHVGCREHDNRWTRNRDLVQCLGLPRPPNDSSGLDRPASREPAPLGCPEALDDGPRPWLGLVRKAPSVAAGPQDTLTHYRSTCPVAHFPVAQLPCQDQEGNRARGPAGRRAAK